MRLVFMIEERSMKEVLIKLLPQILPASLEPSLIIPHNGRSDLIASIGQVYVIHADKITRQYKNCLKGVMMNYDITELEEVWSKGNSEMPDKLKHVVTAAQEELLLQSLQLPIDVVNTIRYNASKKSQTVNDYIATIILGYLQAAM